MENSSLTNQVPLFGTLFDGNVSKTFTELYPGFRLVITIVVIFNVFLSIITLSFGVVSWCLLPKWRRMQHYVFLNVAFVSDVYILGFHFHYRLEHPTNVAVLMTLINRTIMTHWLLATTIMFYMDIVKVFNISTTRKYLKVNMFCWVLPCIEMSSVYAIDVWFKTNILELSHYVLINLLLSVSFGLYFKVFYHLFVVGKAQKITRRQFYSKIYLAVGSFSTAGFSTLFPMVVAEMVHADLMSFFVAIFISLLTVTGAHIAFYSLKPHRELWAQYRNRDSNQC